MKRRRNVWATATALAVGTTLLATGVSSLAAQNPEKRCTRATTAVRSRILHTDTKRLARCAIAVQFAKPAGETEDACRRLRTRGEGVDLVDSQGRDRILKRCRGQRPHWLGDLCPGPGPWTDLATPELEDFASCMTSSAHCLARDAIEPLLGPLEESVGTQHLDNLEFEYGMAPGNSFAACAFDSTTTTTLPESTSTTMVTPSTTTTSTTSTTLVDPPPTTTTTMPVDPGTTTTTTTTLPLPTATTFVITEFMSNPSAQSDTTGEYFEVKNTGTLSASLQGATFRDDGSNSFTIQDPLTVAPGGYVVLGKSATAAGGLVDFVYGSGMALSNSSDEIILEIGGEVVDLIAYDSSFPLQAGVAAELSPNAETPESNDSGANWCESVTDLGDGDLGSPGTTAGGCSP